MIPMKASVEGDTTKSGSRGYLPERIYSTRLPEDTGRDKNETRARSDSPRVRKRILEQSYSRKFRGEKELMLDEMQDKKNRSAGNEGFLHTEDDSQEELEMLDKMIEKRLLEIRSRSQESKRKVGEAARKLPSSVRASSDWNEEPGVGKQVSSSSVREHDTSVGELVSLFESQRKVVLAEKEKSSHEVAQEEATEVSELSSLPPDSEVLSNEVGPKEPGNQVPSSRPPSNQKVHATTCEPPSSARAFSLKGDPAVSKQQASIRIPPRTFKAYENTPLETPMFHLIMQPFFLNAIKPLLSYLYRARWVLAHPMSTSLFPKWTQRVPLPSRIRNLTVGECILTVPLLIQFLRGYHYTFVSPNLTDGGRMASYAIFLSFLTANKSNSLFSFLFGIPFERMIPLHLQSAVVAIVLGCFHVHVAFKYGGDDDGDSKHADFGDDPAIGKFLVDGDTNLSGTLLLACMMGTVGLSLLPIVRRAFFNLWLCSHILLALGVLITLFLHGVSSSVFVTAWLLTDWVVRYGIMVGCRNRTQATLRLIGHKGSRRSNEPAIEISFPKPRGFEYNPGQFVQIAIPKLSVFEFHPVSISSSPHEDRVTLHIRRLGDWTGRLVKLAETTDTTEVWMEGPYGALSVDLDDDRRYKMCLFVSGGIGVTPCQSIGKSLLHQHTALGRKLKEVKFVWAVRDLGIVDDIPPLESDQDYSVRGPWYKSSFMSKRDERDDDNGTLRVPAVVQVDIHCTRRVKDEELGTGSLPYNLYSGRPNLDAIFEEMKKKALEKKQHSVAVIGCGPKSLMVALQDACRKHSASVVGCDNGIFFDLHLESFDL